MLSHSVHSSNIYLKDENNYKKILHFLPFFTCFCFLLFFSSYISPPLSLPLSLPLSVTVSHGFYIQFFFPSIVIVIVIYCTSILLHMQHWTSPTIYHKTIIHVQSLQNCVNHKAKST